MFGTLRGTKAEPIDLFLRVELPHPTGPGRGGSVSTIVGPIAFFPHRHEFAWKLLLCVGRTLLNVLPKELYPKNYTQHGSLPSGLYLFWTRKMKFLDEKGLASSLQILELPA